MRPVKRLRFYCTVPSIDWRDSTNKRADLQECSFLLKGNADGTRQLRYEQKVSGGSFQKERILTNDLHALTFRFYDGLRWKGDWSSNEVLPKAVEVKLTFRQESQRDPYKSYTTTILIPCARS